MVYQWTPGARVKGIAPQVAGTHLEKLRKKNGELLTPRIVVADAKLKTSPLHEAFEWDVRKAAELHWESRASYILRSIVLVNQDEDGVESIVRAFVSIHEEDDGEQGYTSIVRAMKDPDLRRQVVAQAKQDFEELRQKYRKLEEFAKVYAELDAVEV